MKRFMNLCLVLMALAATALTTQSCGGDDEKKSDDLDVSVLVGTWKEYFSTGYSTYTFNADGTGVGKEVDPADRKVSTWTFTYTYDATTKILVIIDDEDNNLDMWQIVALDKTSLVYKDKDGELCSMEKQ